MNFRGKYKPDPVGFQIIPMIDILFLLLIFFVASQIYTQWEAEVDITLPTAKTAQIAQRLPGEIILNVMRDGQVVVNGKRFDGPGLTELLRRVVQYFPNQPVLIRADRNTAYFHIIDVLDTCRRCEIWNISFATITAEQASAP